MARAAFPIHVTAVAAFCSAINQWPSVYPDRIRRERINSSAMRCHSVRRRPRHYPASLASDEGFVRINSHARSLTCHGSRISRSIRAVVTVEPQVKSVRWIWRWHFAEAGYVGSTAGEERRGATLSQVARARSRFSSATLILVRHHDGHNGFSGITGTHHQFQGHLLSFHRATITGYPIQRKAQLIT